MNVYECKLCGNTVMQPGLAIHMIKAHRLYPEFYGPTELEPLERLRREPDLEIRYHGVPRGKGGYTWVKGTMIAEWVFQLKPPDYLRMAKGDRRRYILWRPGRVRYLREKYGRRHLETSYLDDYPELFQEGQV